MVDYVYYLKVEDEIIYEFVFGTEKEAIEFAEKEALNNYEILRWDVQ
jgi:hypothetical protein